MRQTIGFLFLLISLNLSGQIGGTIIDKSTGLPIQYANVFIQGKPIGTTTDIKGNFEIKSTTSNEIIIVSAIGYDSQQIKADSEATIIQLVPRTYELSGIIVKPRKNKTQLTIGTYNKNKINDYFGCAGYPWIVTKYFEFKPEYNSIPHLKQLKIMSSAISQDSVIFNLRLLSIKGDGSPGTDLLNKNLIVTAQSGRNKNTVIDLSSFNLTFPSSGLIIAVEWLIINQNKSDSKYGLQYLPQFGSVTKDGESKTWNYVGGKWFQVTLFPPTVKNKYKELAAELTLTN
jgi:hypothetical protein